MQLIPLTKDYCARVDDADFEWLNQWMWYSNIVGKRVYAVRVITVNGKNSTLSMHRQILGITDPKTHVDHISGNGLDNTRGNLRACTSAQNCWNAIGKPNSISIYKGVSWRKDTKRWIAQIKIHGKHKSLGCFDKEEDAARAYNEGAKLYFGEFARFNNVSPMFPEQDQKRSVLRNSNTSGFRGVYFNKRDGAWVSRIFVKGKAVSLGYFSNPVDAAHAYDFKAKEMLGDSAILNFQ